MARSNNTFFPIFNFLKIAADTELLSANYLLPNPNPIQGKSAAVKVTQVRVTTIGL